MAPTQVSQGVTVITSEKLWSFQFCGCAPYGLNRRDWKGRARKPIQAIDWNNLSEEQVKAFQEIKKLLVTAPVLAIPDLNKPFQVHTDASMVGTGGVLMQEGHVVLYTNSKFAPKI